MALEQIGYIFLRDWVTPQLERGNVGDVKRWSVTVDFSERWRACVTPTTVGEVIPCCFATERAFSF
jgi:hypothetical protein